MKTISLKKVSAVAVASLGFGLLSVVPAQAALATTVAKVGPGAAGDAAPGTAQNLYTSVGTEVTSDIRILTTTDETNAGAITITPTVACAGTVTTVCTGGLTVGTPGTGKVGMTLTGPTLGATIATTATANKWTASVADGVESLTYSSGTIPAIATTALQVVGRLSMTPTIPGIYTVTLTPAGAVTTNTATVYTLYVSGAAGTVGTAGVGTTSVSASTGGNAVVEFFTANGTTVGSVYNITSSGVGSIVSAQGYTTAHGTASLTTPYNGTTGDYSAGAKFTTATATTPSSATVTLASAVAGTQTITVTAIDATTGNPTTAASVTVTWGSAPAVSAAYSTAFIGSGTAFPSANWDPAVAIAKTAGVSAAQATIGITLKDQNQATISGVPLTATVSGPGLITCSAGTGTGATGTVRACSLTAAQMTTNVARIGITADGTAGTGTITITSGTTTIATKTVVFYGSVATLTATQNLSVARAACSTSCVLGSSAANPAGTTVATTPAVIIVAKDSTGNVVPGLTISAVSSDATVLSGATILESNGLGLGDGYAGLGYYNASVSAAPAGTSGKSATITFRVINPADGVSYITTAAVKFTLGGSVATGTVSAAFDKTTYTAGEKATFTVTAKDSSGNPIYDQDLNLWGGTGTAPVFSKSVNGSTPSAAATAMFVGGKKAYAMYAPSLGGAFSAAGTLDSLTVLSGAAVSASASVTDANAGLLTQIDALNAKIVALNALIAKIMKKLGVK